MLYAIQRGWDLVLSRKIIKGATVRLSYGVTEGDPTSVSVSAVGMRQRINGVLSGPTITPTVEPRAATRKIVGGFDIVFPAALTGTFAIGTYRMDTLVLITGGPVEQLSPILIIVEASGIDL